MTNELYERINSLCLEKGVSGSRMCKELGFSASLLSDMKHGRRQVPRSDRLNAIAGYLGVTMGNLLEGIKVCSDKSHSPKRVLLQDSAADFVPEKEIEEEGQAEPQESVCLSMDEFEDILQQACQFACFLFQKKEEEKKAARE